MSVLWTAFLVLICLIVGPWNVATIWWLTIIPFVIKDLVNAVKDAQNST